MGVNKIFVVFILSIIAKNANLLPTSYYSKLEIFKGIITNSGQLQKRKENLFFIFKTYTLLK